MEINEENFKSFGKERKVMKPLITPIQLKLKKHNIQTNK